MYFIYILQSEKDQGFYIGQTNNLTKRLSRHNTGQVKSTRNRVPLKIVISEKYETRSDAMRREKYLKSLKSGREFKKILTHWGVAKW
ncbi:GIY-YIG nuclease family protein [Candidatus Gracilibacteria bacterium]|nr:GIY-YIG nuclease family protein [Candidatus Gracilibacteria bacterium]MCF7856752.1 GIY-YIG nuclease family protein [Candidatus Gracilibacteria bacterium]MCF7897042.1 GIY-YIG nuclease family protein [Candidatus Gracilibacteria bacterium]